MRPLPGHSDFVLRVSFSPDGRWLASCGVDNRVVLRDLQEGTHVELDYQPRNWVSSLAFSPDGCWLALGEHHGRVVLFDRETHRHEEGPQVPSRVSGVAFTPCGKHLVWCDYSGTIGLWTVGQTPRVLCQQTQEQYTVAVSPSGKYLAASGRNGHVLVWSLPFGSAPPCELIWDDPEGCRSLVFDPLERTLIAGLGRGLIAWDIAEDGCLWEIEHPAVVSCVDLSADGLLIATGAWDGLVRTYHRDCNDAATPRLRRELHLGQDRIYDLALSRDGMVGAVAGQHPEPLVLWDVD